MSFTSVCIGLFELPENLGLTDHLRVEPCGDFEQMLKGFKVIMAISELLIEFRGHILFIANELADFFGAFDAVGKAVDFEAVACVKYWALSNPFKGV